MGRAALVVTHPQLEAADRANDTLFAARAALQRALYIRRAAELQVEQLRALVARLEGKR